MSPNLRGNFWIAQSYNEHITTATLGHGRPRPDVAAAAAAYSFVRASFSLGKERGGSWKGREGGRKEGEKDCERGGVGSELLERTNESVVKVRQQCEVEESERPSAIIDWSNRLEHDRKMRVSFISGDHNYREKWAPLIAVQCGASVVSKRVSQWVSSATAAVEWRLLPLLSWFPYSIHLRRVARSSSPLSKVQSETDADESGGSDCCGGGAAAQNMRTRTTRLMCSTEYQTRESASDR